MRVLNRATTNANCTALPCTYPVSSRFLFPIKSGSQDIADKLLNEKINTDNPHFNINHLENMRSTDGDMFKHKL